MPTSSRHRERGGRRRERRARLVLEPGVDHEGQPVTPGERPAHDEQVGGGDRERHLGPGRRLGVART
jgi:hypothetical protein